jgi:hypothetical protein
MSNRPDWSEWILQKNRQAREEELKKSNSVYVESLDKASTELRNAVKQANNKLKSAGVKGRYGLTASHTPHWEYEYKPEHESTVKEAHALVEPHLPHGHTHEDYDTGEGSRHTYGGDPDHINETAAKHPRGLLSDPSKKLRSASYK